MSQSLFLMSSLCLVAAAGCHSGPDVHQIEQSLAVAAPIAYVATLAAAAEVGKFGECVLAASDGSAVIEVSARCPLPLTPEARGTIVVTGIGNGASSVYAASFIDVSADKRKLVVKNVAAFTASSRTDGLTVVYAAQDVELTSKTSAKVQQSAWIVTVATNDTPENTADDTVRISGSYQLVDGGSTVQSALSGVELAGSCPRNPVAGTATLEDVGSGSINITTLKFHPACDGKADVPASVSLSSLVSTGSTVTLDFLD